MRERQAYLTHLGTAVPQTAVSQADAADFMVQGLGLSEVEARRLRAIYRASAIQKRHTVLPDYTRTQDFDFFPNTPGLVPFPSTADRMRVYQQQAAPLAISAVEAAGIEVELPEITHLITVSCTGLYAPGLDLELVKRLGLSRSVARTAIQFMGCYAAFNALKAAQAFVLADPRARVLVVSVELCTLHFQKDLTEDNLVANALFADGAAAAVIAAAPAPGKLNLRLDHFATAVLPEGNHDMAWQVGNTGFEMRLSTFVPRLLEHAVRPLLERLVAAEHLTLADAAWYAVHPGGRRILEAVEAACALSREANAAAYHVLRHFGNMSSATIFFVWQHLLAHPTAEAVGQPGLSMAFGPGLTVEAGLFTLVPGAHWLPHPVASELTATEAAHA